MKVSKARNIIKEALDLGLIDFNEAARRQNAISRVSNKPRQVNIWVLDLVDLVEQRQHGNLLTIGGMV